MKRIFAGIVMTAVLIALFMLPVRLSGLAAELDQSSELFSLLRLYLTTCAFVGALWAIYVKDTRLRANSDNVLVALVYFLIATICLVTAIVVVQIPLLNHAFRTQSEGSTEKSVSISIAQYLAFLSLEIYLISFIVLLVNVFMKTYNQLYNLRTNKVIKYFKPIRYLRAAIGPHKRYEYEVETRKLDRESCSFAEHFSDDELIRLISGATILVKGSITDETISLILDWMMERMTKNETANYAVADRHPIDIWKMLKAKNCTEQMTQDLVLIDCYSPSFAFTDDIHEENDKRLTDDGVALVKAKTFAGLHTANNYAFNIIKERENKKQKNKRRPTVMVYAHISALCDFESVEQFRVFWRHVIPSERSYGMLTFIVEDELGSDAILDPLTQLVDFALEVSKNEENGTTILKRAK
ncbi:MAG: hypothetical protein JNL18_22295 [Planctomycetaceae bacterium]|nr:hypothetical protein [Planctomycetaceae bacterium]